MFLTRSNKSNNSGSQSFSPTWQSPSLRYSLIRLFVLSLGSTLLAHLHFRHEVSLLRSRLQSSTIWVFPFSKLYLITGGSIPLVVVLAILSGIIGVLVGGYILKLLRIPAGTAPARWELRLDDYVTRGVSLGINASAISTAQLLTTDPRAAALSSLSFAYISN